MFIVLLRFSANKDHAGHFMQGHRDWIARGFDDGVFLLSGSLKPTTDEQSGGGSILAHKTSLRDLETRVQDDPFVVENVVRAEILEIAPSQAGKQLAFVMS